MIVEYDPESAILEESNTFDLEGLYLDEPWADDNWIAKYDSEEQRRAEEPAGVIK